MRLPVSLRHLAAVAVLLACVAPFSALGQAFGASVGTDPVITASPDASRGDVGMGKVAVPGHRRGAEELRLFGRVRSGVYTVDGMVAKVQLNYDVNGVRFLYLFLPGVGTAVVSATPNPEAIATEAKLQDNELSFALGEHRFRLTGVALASDRGSAPEHLYVWLDRAAWQLHSQPMVGFGDAVATPYVWPGALRVEEPKAVEDAVAAPPVPLVLLPSPTAVAPRPAVPATVQPAALRPVTFP